MPWVCFLNFLNILLIPIALSALGLFGFAPIPGRRGAIHESPQQSLGKATCGTHPEAPQIGYGNSLHQTDHEVKLFLAAGAIVKHSG